MSHLGRWLSALIDGELEGDERDRVLNHVAGCDGCRQEANAMRALKRRLTALGETAAEPAIASRLMELARSSRPATDDVAVALAGSSGGYVPSGPSHTIRPGFRLLTAAAGTALAAVGVIAFLLGSTNGAPAPKVTPSVDSYQLQHAYDAGQAPGGSTPYVAPASGFEHGARVAGPALGRPEQFGPGPATAVAASGAGPGTRRAVSGATARLAGSHPGPVRSSTPMVSQHLG